MVAEAAGTKKPGTVRSKKPSKLSGLEKLLSVVLILLGLTLTFGPLAWYGLAKRPTTAAGQQTSGSATGLISKVSVATSKAGEVTSTTEYSDTILIFTLTAGVALILCGAFYGRMHEIKLGGLDMTLGSLSEESKEKLEASVKSATATATVADPDKPTVEASARALALG